MNGRRVQLLVFVIGVASRVAAQQPIEWKAQGALFEQPKHILLYADKPEGVDDLDYRALITQAEVRLRLARFTVQSGTTAQFTKDQAEWGDKIRNAGADQIQAVMEQYTKTHPPSTTVTLELSTLRVQGNERSLIYHAGVAVMGTALIPTDHSALQIEVKDRQGKPLPSPTRAHYATVYLFRSSGQFGVSNWKAISDGAVTQIDEFINEYLIENPKK